MKGVSVFRPIGGPMFGHTSGFELFGNAGS
jgi:hypothetical protein